MKPAQHPSQPTPAARRRLALGAAALACALVWAVVPAGAQGPPPPPPPALTITGTNPPSPSKNPFPRVEGLSNGTGQQVIYGSANCDPSTELARGGGNPSTFSIQVTVPRNQSTPLSANTFPGGPCSNTITYTHDDIPPAAPTLDQPDSPSSNVSATYKGTASSDTVRIRTHDLANCEDPTGDFTKAQFEAGVSVSSGLQNSSTQLSVQAFDAAGNSSCSNNVDYTHDDLVPGPPSITATDPASPSNSLTPKVKGTASEDTETVEIFTQAGCAGPATSGSRAAFLGAGIPVPVAPNTTTQLSARALDAAGNPSTRDDVTVGCSNDFPYTHSDQRPLPPPPTAPTCQGETATILGTRGADKLRGTNGADVISGLGGDDRIKGLQGEDTICGGTGNDRLGGGKGADELNGGSGTDFCKGGEGTDQTTSCEQSSQVPKR